MWASGAKRWRRYRRRATYRWCNYLLIRLLEDQWSRSAAGGGEMMKDGERGHDEQRQLGRAAAMLERDGTHVKTRRDKDVQ